MAIQSTTLRPGVLVSLKTSVRGNVKYVKEIIGSKIVDGTKIDQWSTTRTIIDPKEHDAARKARSKARALIYGACTQSAFGLLCPDNAAEALAVAIGAARKIAAEFNDGANLTRVAIYVITGKIAANDTEAVLAINSEVSDLLEEMQTGLKNADAETIREAASRVKKIGLMLSPDAAARVQLAVEAARKAAREIAAADDGEAVKLDQRALSAITDARTAFLDLEGAKEIGSAAGGAESRALDIEAA